MSSLVSIITPNYNCARFIAQTIESVLAQTHTDWEMLIVLDAAQGEYIAFLASDDLWKPCKLERQIAFMSQHVCDFSYSRYDLIDEDGSPLGKTARIPVKLTYRKLLHHDFIGCLTAVYRADFVRDIRSFIIKNNNDYGLFFAGREKGEKYHEAA